MDQNAMSLCRLSGAYEVTPGKPPHKSFIEYKKGQFRGDEEEVFEANANLHMHLSI